MFHSLASNRILWRTAPSAIPCRLASSRLFSCIWIAGCEISAFNAALRVLMACSTMLRLSNVEAWVFLAEYWLLGWQHFDALELHRRWRTWARLHGLAVVVSAPNIRRNVVHWSPQFAQSGRGGSRLVPLVSGN